MGRFAITNMSRKQLLANQPIIPVPLGSFPEESPKEANSLF